MAKQRIANYVFLPGISSTDNLFPNAYSLITSNKTFIKKESAAWIAAQITADTAQNLYPNAITLLTNNKEFLKEEITSWIAAQVLASAAPFVGFTYDSAKCKRDVGYVIDAYIYDIRYGGNEKTISTVGQYWLSGVPQVDGDRTPEVAAHTKLRDIIVNNILPRVAYTSQQSPVVQTQNITAPSGEAAAITKVTTLAAIVTGGIANGLSGLPAISYSNYNFAGYIYDTDKCERDVGYVLDAYLNDLRYGGNTKIRLVSSRYWYNGVAQVDGDRKPEIVTHQFIRDLINNYLLPQATYTPIQGSYPQIKNPSITAEGGANARITTLVSILTDVITNGVSSLPAAVNGVTTIRIQGKYDLDKLLLITNVTENLILFNFSDPNYGGTVDLTTTYNSNTYDSDQDFPAYLQISDYITELTLKVDTSTCSATDDIQIFVEAPEQRIRPYDFGTDAIERMRVAQPQSMLDADFEYGLQPTKWQAIGVQRGYPSVYEVPGTDTAVSTVTTDASTGTGGVGQSLITVTTTSAHGLTVGTPITIKALADSIQGFSRAEGTFIINSVPSTTTFTYYSVSKVGTSNGQVLSNTYTQLRKAAFYTGAALGSPVFSVVSNGASSTFNTKFVTTSGSDQIAFTGTAPVVGAPLTASGINPGTQVTSVVGSGGLAVTANVGTIAQIGDTSIDVQDATGILEGMAIDNGSGTAIFVSGIVGTTVSLTGSLTTVRAGSSQTYTNVSGSNAANGGSGATFDVTRTSGTYATVSITAAGSGYRVGNRITIPGTSLGGTSPSNDLTIEVSTINGSGGITAFAPPVGTSISGNAVYANRGQVNGIGSGFNIDVTVTAGNYTISINNAGADYIVNERVIVLGTDLGGTSPANDLLIEVDTVNGTGGILTYTLTGTGTGTGTFLNQLPANRIGTGGTFDIDKTAGVYTASITAGGTGYAIGDVIIIRGTSLGGLSTANDLILTVNTVSAGAITDVSESGTGTYDTTFSSVSGSTLQPDGSGATFDITRSGGSYTAITLNLGGNNYRTGDRITVLGTSLGGVILTNDATINIVTASGGIPTSLTISGTAVTGDAVPFYSSVSLSEVTTLAIADNTSVSASAIATIGVTFSTNHGLVPGASILVDINSVGSNHTLAAGPFYVERTPSLTTIRYTAKTTGTIDTSTLLTGTVYVRPDSYFVHRPFDGGVQLGTGGPQHGAQAIRMSKKYIRYQSGKGIMYTTGALFAPSYNLQSLNATGTSIGSFITVTTDDVDHGCQVGGRIRISGVDTAGYNGEYTISDIVNERSFRIQAITVLANVYATISANAQMNLLGWHGATVRAGTFDDQNGMFWQYDGTNLAVGKRSSTFQLAGVVSIAKDTNLLTGTNTRFRDQLQAGDRIVIRGMTHVVSNVTSQTSLTVTPDYRGTNNCTNAKACLVQDQIIPQSQFNMDRLDGTGPSGYNLDISKMQMIGMQWSWYGAGFIDFMLRGSDGNYVFVHRIRNSNVNTEAYMRTGNSPVRYEVINEGPRTKLSSSITAAQTTLPLIDASGFPNESGVVLIENELVSFTGKSGNTLTGCTRAAPMVNFVGGAQRSFQAGSAATHEYNTGVVLVSNTISPIISHWGSAMLTDGLFDEDRGYIFNYAATNVSITTSKQTAFMIRLAPSVSNAIIGDLGDRELLNRAQLLLQGLEITADTGTGGIVIEGVLNPQNYPTDPGSVTWGGLQNASQGGQPSFAQIAPGGGITWASAAPTTATATSQAFPTGSVTARAVYFGGGRSINSGNNFFFITAADYTTYISQGFAIGDVLTNNFPANTTITNIVFYGNISGTNYYYCLTSQAANTNVVGATTVNTRKEYRVTTTSTIFFQPASFTSSAAVVGSEVSDALFPAGTKITSASTLSYFGTSYTQVTFNQTSSSSAITPGTTTITFKIGAPLYALPGETVFSFVAAPGTNSSLDLSALKELTNTTLGGRGTYPNGPDVLAINVYKAAGTAIPANIVLRWGEAQA